MATFSESKNRGVLEQVENATGEPTALAFRDTDAYIAMFFSVIELTDARIVQKLRTAGSSHTFVLWRGPSPKVPREILAELQAESWKKGFMLNFDAETDVVGKMVVKCTVVNSDAAFVDLSKEA